MGPLAITVYTLLFCGIRRACECVRGYVRACVRACVLTYLRTYVGACVSARIAESRCFLPPQGLRSISCGGNAWEGAGLTLAYVVIGRHLAVTGSPKSRRRDGTLWPPAHRQERLWLLSATRPPPPPT